MKNRLSVNCIFPPCCKSPFIWILHLPFCNFSFTSFSPSLHPLAFIPLSDVPIALSVCCGQGVVAADSEASHTTTEWTPGDGRNYHAPSSSTTDSLGDLGVVRY